MLNFFSTILLAFILISCTNEGLQNNTSKIIQEFKNDSVLVKEKLQKLKRDSLFTKTTLKDSLFKKVQAKKDSIKPDSVKKYNTPSSPINYFAQTIINTSNDKGQRISIYKGKAKIIYEDMKMEAYQIIINHEENRLYASPKEDTLQNGDISIFEEPVFTQSGNDPMYGYKMEYDFKTKRGRVFDGRTSVKPAKYEGEEIKKFGEKTILIRDGRFTTCDADSPSYWFHSSMIRMIRNDMIFTGPVFMYLYDIPFPIPLPVGVFSMKKGKHSGVILPAYADDGFRGRGLEHLGYFFDISEQFQASLSLNYFEKTDFSWKLNTVFRDRYNYDGSFSGTYAPKNQSTGVKEDNFGFNYNYNHRIDPSLYITGNGTFSSSLDRNRFANNFETQANQLLTSALSITKNWDNGMSLSSYQSFTKNLLTNASSYTLPELRFSTRGGKLFSQKGADEQWYNLINFSYGSSLRNTWSRASELDKQGSYQLKPDEYNLGAVHNLGLSAPFKILKYFTFNPSITYTEAWTNKLQEIDESSSDTLKLKTISKFGALRTFSFGSGISTNLFGMFEPNIGDLKFIRHKLTPSVGFNYTPNFTSDAFPYTQTISQAKFDNNFVNTRKDGSKYIDRFKYSIFGQTPNGESLNASFGLSNSFSAKYINEKKEESKVEILQFNSSASYNFLAESFNWSDIGTNFSLPFITFINLNANMTHSIYNLSEKGTRLNSFANLPILTRFSTSTSVRIDEKMFQFKKNDSVQVQDKTIKDFIYSEAELELLKKQNIPWNLDFNFSYEYSKFSEQIHTFTSDVRGQLSLTKNWKVSYSANLDLENIDINYQNVSVSRDLECWTFSFNYAPNPYNRYFSLTLAIKEDMLKDLKYERRSRRTPVF